VETFNEVSAAAGVWAGCWVPQLRQKLSPGITGVPHSRHADIF
jgi:hypothetical protein